MHRTAKVANAILVSTLVVIGCGQGAGGSTAFSDRQIFEGAVFGAGPVASLIPEARDHLRPELYARSSDELSAMEAARSATIDAIQRADPGFLAEFARAARSGDPARVERMVTQSVQMLSDASRASALSTNRNIPGGDSLSPNRNIPGGGATSTNRNIPGALRMGLPQNMVNPGLNAFSSRLFTEQLSNSVAITFQQAGNGG